MDVSLQVPELTKQELQFAYRVAVRHRVLSQLIIRRLRKGTSKFWIGGPGEEVHGVATAFGIQKATNGKHVGISPHYRSGALCATWTELNDRTEPLVKDIIRQMLNKATDPLSGGVQMVNHLEWLEGGILPVQSQLGSNLLKAVGYAKALKLKGINDACVFSFIGDGTTAESDLHDASIGTSVWKLPICVTITDNNIAISTKPEDGHGIKSLEDYGKGFGMAYFESDGTDFFENFSVSFQAATHCKHEQQPGIWHVKGLPRLNGHSSAADYRFDFNQPDPLLGFGQTLVERGTLEAQHVCMRKENFSSSDFFEAHQLGTVMEEEFERLNGWFQEVEREPDPTLEHLKSIVRPPFPAHEEPEKSDRQTNVTIKGALRAAHHEFLETYPDSFILGEDIGKLGGVFRVTSSLKEKFGDRVIDSPLNERLIVGTALGAALSGTKVVFEHQFIDYSPNSCDWFIYLGNLHYTTSGKIKASVIGRLPCAPLGGGSVYHSMSLEGLYSAIPGLVIVMPSSSVDAYGLFMAAVEYGGPVLFMEPKALYGLALGWAFPDEPNDEAAIKELRKAVNDGKLPDIGKGVRVPLGKGSLLREGADLTLVSWGLAVPTCLNAAEYLKPLGVHCDVIDLRTLVPPDMELVFESVSKTGRLIVASAENPFSGFGRQIQGQVVEQRPKTPTKLLGMEELPGIPQHVGLEEQIVLNLDKVVEAAKRLVEQDVERNGSVTATEKLPTATLHLGSRGYDILAPEGYSGVS